MYNDVWKFIDACDQIPSNETISLYNSLIIEEFLEFKQARLENDTIEELDACMDLIWVILGFCKMKGFDVNGAWAEVARSNLAKIDSATGKVIKRPDGKVLKPAGWTAPNLASFI